MTAATDAGRTIQYGPQAEYAPGIVVTPGAADFVGPQRLPAATPVLRATTPSLFSRLQTLPKPVLIGGALLLALVVLQLTRRK